MLRLLLLGAAFLAPVLAIPIDNGVEGDPEIECGPTSITVSFNTRNPFEGHVYVKGLYAQAECRNDQTGGRVASISLPFGKCNTNRTRSLNPRGIFVHATVVISFHPQFVTKIDRAYRVQCFYMEADKTVSQELEVSELTTGFQTNVVPMPICRYDILEGGPNGTPVRYTIIGQQVYHKWTCDTETVDTFCMQVYSCFVDDGAGERATLLNEQGCAQDRYLLRNLEYLTDLMAGQETHVFKYADRPQLFFNCQIRITIKEPGTQCEKPQCPEPGSAIRGGGGPAPAPAGNATAGRLFARRFRFSRDTGAQQEVEGLGVLDVRAEISTLDIDTDTENKDLPIELRSQRPHRPLSSLNVQPAFRQNGDGVCLSSLGFGILVALFILIFVGAITTVGILCFKQSSKSSQ